VPPYPASRIDMTMIYPLMVSPAALDGT